MAIKKKLKPEVLAKCKESKEVINGLAYEWLKHSNTIKNWLNKETDELTKSESLKVISEGLGINKNELLIS